MSKSNQSYKELAIPYFKEVFDIIDEVLTTHDIPYYLIGMNAISLELLKKGIKPARGPKTSILRLWFLHWMNMKKFPNPFKTGVLPNQ